MNISRRQFNKIAVCMPIIGMLPIDTHAQIYCQDKIADIVSQIFQWYFSNPPIYKKEMLSILSNHDYSVFFDKQRANDIHHGDGYGFGFVVNLPASYQERYTNHILPDYLYPTYSFEGRRGAKIHKFAPNKYENFISIGGKYVERKYLASSLDSPQEIEKYRQHLEKIFIKHLESFA